MSSSRKSTKLRRIFTDKFGLVYKNHTRGELTAHKPNEVLS